MKIRFFPAFAVVAGLIMASASVSFGSSDEYEFLVSKSDDFDLYRKQFAKAARHLVENKKCTRTEIADHGGFVKSVSRGSTLPSIYFLYCGGSHRSNRLYLNPETGNLFK